jgi:type IV secretory pathway TraG/TraD family ATPase VirD4
MDYLDANSEYTVLSDSVVINDTELNQHALIIGTTGAGKTNTILNFVDSALARNLPVIYLDGKGSIELITMLSTIADKYQRTFKVFSLRPDDSITNLASYNPFSSGNATEWKNRIMSLFSEAKTKGQEHFSLAEQNYINFVSNVLYQMSIKKSQVIDLKVLLTFLENPELLLHVAKTVDGVLADKLATLHKEPIAGDVIKLLELFIYSSYGELLDTTDKSNIISLKESILNHEMVLFLFDASAYPEDTKKIAKMVISDINSSFSSFDKFTKALCIFDEFASYASSNLAETISLQRSQGMHAIIGTQSIATVKLKSADTARIAEELIACCNTYIIHRINHVEDAGLFANVIGSSDIREYTMTVFDKKPKADRALGSSKMVQKFKITPDEIKQLQVGEAIIYRKANGSEVIRTNIRNIFASPDISLPIMPKDNFIRYVNSIWGLISVIIIGFVIVELLHRV